MPCTPALKHCPYCGMAYRPYARAAKTQRHCHKAACRKKHKQALQAAWHKKNPDYFKDQYPKKKFWHKTHPGYQAEYRAKHPGQAHKDNLNHIVRRRKQKRFSADIQVGLLRRRAHRILGMKCADIQETLKITLDGVICLVGGLRAPIYKTDGQCNSPTV